MHLLRRDFNQLLNPRRFAYLAAVLSISVLSAYASAADLDTFCSKPQQQDAPQEIRDFYNKRCVDYLKSQVEFKIAGFSIDPKNFPPIAALMGVIGTLVGVYLTSFFANQKWRRETKFQIQSDRFKEGSEFIDDLSDLIGKRYFLLSRYFDAVEASQTQVAIDEKEKEYFKVVKTWNFSSRKNMNKLRLLIDVECAITFLDFDDDFRGQNPLSLHYKFVIAHRAVQDFRNAKASAQPVAVIDTKLKYATKKVERVNWACSTFLESITTKFMKRAVNLQLLKVPETAGPAAEAFERRFTQHDTN
ncbi:hypothetical protein B0G75_105452 [Paraburkholderia sp. BL18I3N2]|uniref:hypothetical protein n=1 Tax=Paraburkholderia sp. BL18I3N2 TaxID=1938799 RepID=UPI000D07C6D1|nr:hypothetical protein [Paraburkholderia sp. BL18I3N2]PRX31662.1 hypothetical protein B0G75_105452 [Paraburkholderia sp. BL18I3N2]